MSQGLYGCSDNDKLRHLILIYMRCASEPQLETDWIKEDIVTFLKTIDNEDAIQYEFLDTALKIVDDSKLSNIWIKKLNCKKSKESNSDLNIDENTIFSKSQDLFDFLDRLENISLYEKAYAICSVNIDGDFGGKPEDEDEYVDFYDNDVSLTSEQKHNLIKEKMIYYRFRINSDELLINNGMFSHRMMDLKSFMKDSISFKPAALGKVSTDPIADRMNIIETFMTTGNMEQQVMKQEEDYNNNNTTLNFPLTLLNLLEDIYRQSNETVIKFYHYIQQNLMKGLTRVDISLMVFIGSFLALRRASFVALINGGLSKQMQNRLKRTSLLQSVNMECGHMIESHKLIKLYVYCEFRELLQHLPQFFEHVRYKLANSFTETALTKIENVMRLKILSESVLVSRPLNIDLFLFKSMIGASSSGEFHLVMQSMDMYYEPNVIEDGSIVYRRCAGPGITGDPIDIVMKLEENSLRLAKYLRSHTTTSENKKTSNSKDKELNTPHDRDKSINSTASEVEA